AAAPPGGAARRGARRRGQPRAASAASWTQPGWRRRADTRVRSGPSRSAGDTRLRRGSALASARLRGARMSIPSLVTGWEESSRRLAERGAPAEKSAGGEWVWTSYAELAARVDRCRSGLLRLGVSPGDRVAVISDNRLDWVVACYAIYGMEGALVPMYQAQLDREREHIL